MLFCLQRKTAKAQAKLAKLPHIKILHVCMYIMFSVKLLNYKTSHILLQNNKVCADVT